MGLPQPLFRRLGIFGLSKQQTATMLKQLNESPPIGSCFLEREMITLFSSSKIN